MKPDTHVYCIHCKHFRIDYEGFPYCQYEYKCNIWDSEDSKPYAQRPMYEERKEMLNGLIGIGIGVIIVIAVFIIWQFIEYVINRFIVGYYKYISDIGFIITLIIISIAIILKCIAWK